MASVMADGGIFGEGSRRQMTYGKRTKRYKDDSNNRHTSHDTTGSQMPISKTPTPSTPSRTQKVLPCRPLSANHVEGDDVFDVPVSDTDDTPKARAVPKSGRTTHATSVKPNSPPKMSTAKRPERNHASSFQAETSKKRKRLGPSSVSHPSPANRHNNFQSPERLRSEEDSINALDQPEDTENDVTSMSRRSRSGSAASSTRGKRKDSATAEWSRAVTRKRIPLNRRKPHLPDSTLDLLRSESSSVEPPKTPQHSIKYSDDAGRSFTPAAQTPDSAASERRVLSTPKQRHLWDQLLGPDDSAIPMKNLGTGSPKKRDRALEDRQYRSMGQRRLVDALLPAPGSDPISLDDVEEDSLKNLEKIEDSNVSEEVTLVASSQPTSQVPTTVTGGSKVTYGQQRSFLSEVTDSIDSLLSQPLDVESAPVGPSTHVVQQPLETLEDEDEEANGAMRNVHELRAAGDSRRFNDEIDRLLVDISDSKKSALSRKRSALLELNTSLADESFKARLTNSGYVHQIFAPCRAEKDPITGSAVAGAIAQMLKNSEDAPCASQLHGIGLMRTLASTMNISRDLKAICKDRSANMSKFAQSTVSDFEQVVKSAFLWTNRSPQKLSPQSIALKSLELLIRRLRSLGNEEMIIDQNILAQLLAIVDDALRKVASQPDAQSPRLIMALSILESSCIATVTNSSDVSTYWTHGRISLLVNCLDTCLGLNALEDSEAGPLSLRICVNLANNSEQISRHFARSTFVGKLMNLIHAGLETLSVTGCEDNARELDMLVLAEGALFNLAEMSDRAREIAAEEFSGTLSAMVKHFQFGQSRSVEADSIDASRANIPYGWLAVLLGNLCQNETARHHVRQQLPHSRLTCLWQSIDEFIRHHKEVDRRQGGEEAETILINRLQAHSDNVKRWDAKASW